MQDHKHDLNDPGHGHRFVDRYPQMNTESGHDGPRGSDIVGDRWDEPHTRSTSTASTGAKVGYLYKYLIFFVKSKVEDVLGARTGSETRPKNMNVIFIMKVW